MKAWFWPLQSALLNDGKSLPLSLSFLKHHLLPPLYAVVVQTLAVPFLTQVETTSSATSSPKAAAVRGGRQSQGPPKAD